MMKIRNYTNDDWTRICEIHDAARKDELSSAGLEDAFLSMEQTAENEGFSAYVVLVAEVDGIVQGFAAFSDVEISWLYVDPRRYSMGVGSALVRAALLATGGSLSVEVLDGNERALSLYKKTGFAVVGRASGQMPGNERFAVSVTELRYNGTAEPR
jgi:ribosomal protein S18 acetylase RimI-like enzyme